MASRQYTIPKTGVASELSLLPQPVEKLFYLGNLINLLDKPRVAIVGSRKASPYGRQVTAMLARELSQAGVVIISGLAIGIDSIAHKTALEAGGRTIAVLPSGLDKIYPSMHNSLAQQIVSSEGALVSEYPDHQQNVMKHHFIARNRIIAGLSQVVIVTEAAYKSGSLHTANFAIEQGIDVFAVPGNISSPSSAGTNHLLKSGALVATKSTDILERLGISQQIKHPRYTPANPAELAIITQLQKKGSQISSDLLHASHLRPEVFLQTLSILELRGVIIQTSSGLWTLQ